MSISENKEREWNEVPRTTKVLSRRGFWLGAVFVFWVVSISIPLGLFSASHQAVLPVAQESVAITPNAGPSNWHIVHVLAEECPCSRSVVEYLLERGSKGEMVEEVVLLGGSDSSLEKLRAAGFEVRAVDSEDFCQSVGSEGVPFFQVVRGNAAPAYSGAYFDSAFRATSGFLDLKTFSRIEAGGFVVNRPVYGCATSERLQSILDPFGFKKAN